MPRDLSHSKVWKHHRGTSKRLLIVSPTIQWYQHWIDGRSYICPGDDCLACTAWLPTSHIGALALPRKDAEPVWLQTAHHAWRSPDGKAILGKIVTVTRPDTVTYVDGEDKGGDFETYDVRASWSVIACMNRLPLPDINVQDALVDLREAARNQLRAVLPILAADDE